MSSASGQVLNSGELLGQLVIDEAAVNELIVATGVSIPVVLWPTAKLVATDILLAETLAADLPESADFDAVFGLLANTGTTVMIDLVPELVRVLLAMCGQALEHVATDVYLARVARIRDTFEPVTV